MKKNLALLALTLSALCARGADDTRLVSGYVNLNDSANVYKALYDNTPIEPEFKLVPKFAIVGADNKFVFSVGATMKFTTSYDWGAPVRNPQGMGPADLQPVMGSDRRLFQMSAGGSGIYFNIIGFPNTANETGLFISLGLDKDANNSYRVNAGQIYMRYRDFQCGYANSLYNDRLADAYTIDSHGPCASGGYSTVGINWQHHIGRHIRLGIGAETPQTSYTQYVPDGTEIEAVGQDALTSHQYVPNFPFYVGYSWGPGHVRLSAMVRSIHYTDLTTGQGHDVLGKGIKLTGNAEFGPVNLVWMGQMGWAGTNCFKDDSGVGLDLVPDQEHPGLLRATKTWGFLTAGQWDVTPHVFTTLQCSYLSNSIPEYTLEATTPYGQQMEHAFTWMGNVVWKISPLFSVGAEYRYAQRHDAGGDSRSNNRVYAMLLMTF